jgi:hypothetical protein
MIPSHALTTDICRQAVDRLQVRVQDGVERQCCEGVGRIGSFGASIQQVTELAEIRSQAREKAIQDSLYRIFMRPV